MRRLLRFLDEHAEECVVFTLLILLVFTINIEVFRRYILNSSGAYSEEIARYLMIAIIYLGISYAMKNRRHITCDVLPDWIPQSIQFFINIISYIIMIILSFFMIAGTKDLVEQQIMLDSRTQAMHVPMWWFTILIGIGYFLLTIRVIETIYKDTREYRKTGRAFIADPNID